MAEADDEKSVSVALPRCVCSWKSCRSYMRSFRDSDPPHAVFNGVIKMKFKDADEKYTKLKEAWDRYLQPEDSKRENWKDGEIKYNVARHHFTETMIQEYLQNKKKWDWTALIAEDDAEFWLFELSEDDSSPISDTETGYLKVPNVSKQHVKNFASTWTSENPSGKVSRQGSDSNLSVMSSKSASKSPKPGTRKQKNKDKHTTGDAPNSSTSLAGLKDLPSASDHAPVTNKSPKVGDKKKSSSSSTAGGDEKSTTSRSRSRKKTSSDDASVKSSKSRKKSPKRTTDKKEEPKDDLEGKILSVPSNEEETAQENGHSNKGMYIGGTEDSKKEIKQLKQELFEERAKAESATEDLAESTKEVEALKKEVRELTEARVKDKEEARHFLSSAQSSVDASAALQSEINQLKEQNIKLQNLSSKRLEMVSQIEKKFHDEIDAGLSREQELKNRLSTQTSKAEAAEEEMKKTKAELPALQKKIDELRESHTSETEDFILSVDNLKKRINSLEEENSNLLAEIDAGKDKSRKLETAKVGEMTKVTELEAEIDQLKDKNRKLALMSTPSSPEMSLNQAIETLQREKDALAAEKEKLSKLNQNQKKVIRSLEGTVDTDNEEVRKRLQREDDLERGAALLANLYFTQKNMESLVEQSANIDLMSGRDLSGDAVSGADQQALLLKDVMERKQKKWWGSLDGIFSHTNYVDEDFMNEVELGAQ